MKNSRKLTGTRSKKSLKRISKLMSGGFCECYSDIDRINNHISEIIYELKESNKKLDKIIVRKEDTKQ